MTYSVGIDLGTTNCALGFVPLADTAAESGTLPIPQLEDVRIVMEHATLPSFLYRPPASGTVQEADNRFGTIKGWAVGSMARKRAATSPGRVVHSAKSWLANAVADPQQAVLPWRSAEVPESLKISPLAASAMLLTHLREVWDARFAAHDPALRLDRQQVVVTVPASFNAAAQQATLDAAAAAGFPGSVRLLEEPQAAFYRFLESAGRSGVALPDGAHIAVVDVGGGTSDFSLFRLEGIDDAGLPRIHRIAVSDHILLGGDNIDLALAHVLEAELVPEGEELEGTAWSHLLARSRELKERCLSGEADPGASLQVAVPRAGAGLLAATLSASLPVSQVREMLLEGFFPRCDRTARPEEASSALHEWGLPYAADFAVTRYLADFLREHPPVDAVLFNGGTLASPLVRNRLVEQLTEWQEGKRPALLDNPEPFHAVARGAALYGALHTRGARRIEAGAARGIFLETAGADGASNFVCVLPRGAQPEVIFSAVVPGLHLQLNQPVRFQAYQAAHDRAEKAGDVVPWNPDAFAPLPPLQTRADAPSGGATDNKRVPVRLESHLNELGLLRVDLVNEEAPGERWPLRFNLRTARDPHPSPETLPISDPGIDEERLQKSKVRLANSFTRREATGGRLTAAATFSTLEKIIGQPRHDWNLLLIRELADAHLNQVESLERSPDHAAVWLLLAGFLLRPGFGLKEDEARIDRLWDAVRRRRQNAGKRRQLAEWILWRRIAGGLSGHRQAELIDEVRAALDSQTTSSEHVRLAGALERVPPQEKEALADRFAYQASKQEAGGYPAPWLASAGLLLNRQLFHATSDYVTSPEAVERVFHVLRRLDWAEPRLNEAVVLFLRAARVVEDPRLNLSPRLRRRIADKLRQSKVPPARLAPLEHYIPTSARDRANLYQEALPPGLTLE